MRLTKKADPDKCGHSGYGIGFDARSHFSLTDGSCGKNVIIFWVDNSSSVYDNNKKVIKILVLGEGLTQGLNDTTITAKAKYSINFTESRKWFVLSLHCNRRNSFLFVNTGKYINSNKTIYTVFR